NAWVVSGERTDSGLPLVAGDSHRPLDTPSVYYQVHIACPDFSVSGYSVPGVPGAPHFSHTEFVAFGMTHGMADYQDIFIERFRTVGGRLEYAYGDGWHPADVVEETLRARGAASEKLQVVRTRHGPVIAGDPAAGWGLALCATGTGEGTPWPDAVRAILLARTADELEEAVRDWTEPVNNYVYADVSGEFGYRLRGRVPVRHSSNRWRPVPGWDGEHEWQGMIPFEEMPHVRNPEAGYVVTCNQRVAPADYPHYIGIDFAPDHRARRIVQRLNAIPPGAVTVEHMAGVHAERTSIPAAVLVRALLDVEFDDPRARRAKDLLLAWDCSMDRDSRAAAIYSAARSHWLCDVLEAALGPLAGGALAEGGRGGPTHAAQLYARAVTAMAAGDGSVLPEGATWPAVLRSALTRAVDELEERLGADMSRWEWGRVHHTRPRHPLSAVFPELAGLLDPPQTPASGDGDTPQQGAYSQSDRYVLTAVSVNRYIHDPADWRRSRWVVPLGASGHPGSPHYADQAGMWANVEYVPQLWDWDEIAAKAESRQELLPGR
ncbi:MAG: penicillin acylase family protein, partial [Gemmatimonadetes bacterium]|nr:penicillin acylase family protein [Gemmatimonadota bacterium]